MGRAYVKKNEILLQIGRWSIERSWERPSDKIGRPAWYHDNTKSYMRHKCPGKKVVKTVYVWPDERCNKCWRCSTAIPDEIKGTWIMHNWEALQDER